MKTKKWYTHQIMNELENDKLNFDFKIDEREVFIRVDAIVNELAKNNYLENWKLSGAGIDEGFITTWEPIIVTDQPNGNPSYLTIPSNYAALPKNRGIDEVYPLRYNTTHQSSVVILSHTDFRLYQNNPAGGMQGRLFGYLKGMQLIFGTCEVGKKYGNNFGVRLVVKDSGQIANDELYPIPADIEQTVIDTAVAWFKKRILTPTDEVRDNKNEP